MFKISDDERDGMKLARSSIYQSTRSTRESQEPDYAYKPKHFRNHLNSTYVKRNKSLLESHSPDTDMTKMAIQEQFKRASYAASDQPESQSSRYRNDRHIKINETKNIEFPYRRQSADRSEAEGQDPHEQGQSNVKSRLQKNVQSKHDLRQSKHELGQKTQDSRLSVKLRQNRRNSYKDDYRQDPKSYDSYPLSPEEPKEEQQSFTFEGDDNLKFSDREVEQNIKYTTKSEAHNLAPSLPRYTSKMKNSRQVSPSTLGQRSNQHSCKPRSPYKCDQDLSAVRKLCNTRENIQESIRDCVRQSSNHNAHPDNMCLNPMQTSSLYNTKKNRACAIMRHHSVSPQLTQRMLSTPIPCSCGDLRCNSRHCPSNCSLANRRSASSTCRPPTSNIKPPNMLPRSNMLNRPNTSERQSILQRLTTNSMLRTNSVSPPMPSRSRAFSKRHNTTPLSRPGYGAVATGTNTTYASSSRPTSSTFVRQSMRDAVAPGRPSRQSYHDESADNFSFDVMRPSPREIRESVRKSVRKSRKDYPVIL